MIVSNNSIRSNATAATTSGVVGLQGSCAGAIYEGNILENVRVGVRNQTGALTITNNRIRLSPATSNNASCGSIAANFGICVAGNNNVINSNYIEGHAGSTAGSYAISFMGVAAARSYVAFNRIVGFLDPNQIQNGANKTAISTDNFNINYRGMNVNLSENSGLFMSGTTTMTNSGSGNIVISGTGDINLTNANSDINLSAGGDINVTGGGNINVSTAGGINVGSGSPTANELTVNGYKVSYYDCEHNEATLTITAGSVAAGNDISVYDAAGTYTLAGGTLVQTGSIACSAGKSPISCGADCNGYGGSNKGTISRLGNLAGWNKCLISCRTRDGSAWPTASYFYFASDCCRKR
jgi:hypothetical protein